MINSILPNDLWDTLAPLLSPERKQKFEIACTQKTNFLRLVLQDVHHPHNIAACLRSAEAFGIQHVDIVHLKKNLLRSKVSKGTAKWLQIQVHKDLNSVVASLKGQGFKIAAALPDTKALALSELPLHEPLALVFGNEHEGMDKSWLQHLDYTFTIPMCGLVQSLNISVSAAISLYQLREKLSKQKNLSLEEQRALLNHYARKIWPKTFEKLYTTLKG